MGLFALPYYVDFTPVWNREWCASTLIKVCFVVTHVRIVLLDVIDYWCSCCLNLVPLLCLAFRWISCSARNRACVLYMKVISRVTREFGLSHSTKIQQHTRVARECQLIRERYHMYVHTYYVCAYYVCTYVHTYVRNIYYLCLKLYICELHTRKCGFKLLANMYHFKLYLYSNGCDCGFIICCDVCTWVCVLATYN